MWNLSLEFNSRDAYLFITTQEQLFTIQVKSMHQTFFNMLK